jgi:hypothetical protein
MQELHQKFYIAKEKVSVTSYLRAKCGEGGINRNKNESGAANVCIETLDRKTLKRQYSILVKFTQC